MKVRMTDTWPFHSPGFNNLEVLNLENEEGDAYSILITKEPIKPVPPMTRIFMAFVALGYFFELNVDTTRLGGTSCRNSVLRATG